MVGLARTSHRGYPILMFIGHFALGFAAKKIAPKTSLGTLLLSVGFVDLLWPFFVMAGLEHCRIDPGNTAVTPMDFYDYPWSHSLVAGIGWAVIFGGIYFACRKYARGAVVLAAGVLSHWVLDFVSHRPDMPLWIGESSPKLGLGLWNSMAATMAVEIPMFIAGVWIYFRATRAKDDVGRWGVASFAAFLFVFYFANLFGPPPPSEKAIAYFGFACLPLFAWPYWADRHRVVRASVR